MENDSSIPEPRAPFSITVSIADYYRLEFLKKNSGQTRDVLAQEIFEAGISAVEKFYATKN